jgi:beta-lactamase regulating signal transducer with metallopeptidase domain
MNWTVLQTVAQISSERILNALPEGIMIALFAWGLLRVLRRQNSGTRFAVWFLALLAVAALPLLNSFGEGRALMAARVSSHLERGSPQPAVVVPIQWAVLVFAVWALGACLSLLRLASGLWRLRQLRRSCSPTVVEALDPVLRKTVEGMAGSRSFASGAVTVAVSEAVRVPAAIGFFKRTIILPAWTLRELSANDLNVILLHELAHLRRWDDWTNLIQKIVRALFFFHPAVWWIESRLSVEREMACDDAVLAETSNPHGYAHCLVSLLEKSVGQRLGPRPLSMAQTAVHRAREASLRLAQILDKNRPAATRVWKPALAMVGIFSVVSLIALPQASEFVGFDSSATNRTAQAYSAAVQANSVVPAEQAAVVRTSLRMDDSATMQKVNRVRTRVSPEKQGVSLRAAAGRFEHDRLRRSAEGGQIVATGFAMNSAMDSSNNASASGDGEEFVPRFQTLVLIETTEYGNSAAQYWRVQVWHVTLLRAVRERMIGVPVANSI